MKTKRFIFILLFSVILAGAVVPAQVDAADFLEILYPAGGETFYQGETYIITWTTWDRYLDRLHGLDLSIDGGSTFHYGLPATEGGSLSWTVGNAWVKEGGVYVNKEIPTTNTARLRLYIRDGRHYLYAYSSIFTIATKPTLLPPSLMTLPKAPLNLTASAQSSTSIALTWVDNATNETGFKVERKTGEGTWNQIAQVGANVTSYTDTGLTAATTYAYRVRAYNTMGNSAYCPEASATTPISFLPPGQMLTFPKAPTNLVAAEASSTALSLSWVDHATNEAGFRLERREPGELWAQITEVGANATSYLDMGLSPDTVYDYRVRAYNIIGNSAYSNEASARTMPATPPPPPMGQTVIRLTIGSSRYLVNGSPRNMDVAPMIREGRTLLPIRFVAEPLGAAVGWDAAQQKATVTLGDKEVELWIGQNRARVNGAYQYIDPANHNVVPIIVPPGRTMLPLRFIAEALGCQVEWNGVTQEVTVIYPAP